MATAVVAAVKHVMGTGTSYSASNAGGAGATSVFVMVNDAASVSSGTYGGVALAEVTKAENNPDIFLWAAGGVPAGNQTFSLVWASYGRSATAWVITTSGVNGGKVNDTYSVTGVAERPHPTQTLDSKPNGIAFDCMMFAKNSSAVHYAPDTGQTELFDEQPNGWATWGASYEVASSTSVVMGISCDGSPADRYGYFAASFDPPRGGSQVITAAIRLWRDFLRDLKADLVPANEFQRRYGHLLAI